MASSSRFSWASALTEPLNLLLLASGGASAALTGSVLPLVVAAGAELAWLVLAPATYKRRALPAPRKEAPHIQEQALLRRLNEAERRRFLALDLARKEIRRWVAEKSDWSADLIEPELDKLDQLLDDFLKLAAALARQSRVLAESSSEELKKDLSLAQDAAEQADDASLQSLLDKARLLEDRLEQRELAESNHQALTAQLDAVEQGVLWFKEQMVQVSSLNPLGERLDTLLQGVEAVQGSIAETEALELSPGRRAARQRLSIKGS